MANHVQKKIKQTRGVLIIVILACAAKLVKIIKDGDAQVAQIVVLAIVIAILAVVLILYSWVDRYTKKEQENYGGPAAGQAADAVPQQTQPQNLKAIVKDVFKNEE